MNTILKIIYPIEIFFTYRYKFYLIKFGNTVKEGNCIENIQVYKEEFKSYA